MPSKELTNIVQFRGGLDTTSDRATLFQAPGKAVRMINFEAGVKGGYRRISGYTKYSESAPDGVGNDQVVAARGYFDGAIAIQGGNVYFSEDGTSWLQVNKDTGDTFVDEATLSGLSSLTRNTGSEHYRFAEYHNGTERELFFVDTLGTNPIGRLVIRDNSGLEYKYQHFDETNWGASNERYPTTIQVHNERLVVAGDPSYKNEVYYSDVFDPLDFIGGGVINVADEVVWCETFRENLIVFGKNSIRAVAGLGDPSLQNVQAITTNIGCIAGGSIQEMAGGLVFLAPDGIRTVAATARIDDFELGTLSSSIHDEVLEEIISKADTNYITSTVIRERSQYRLFIEDDGSVINGIGGVLRGPTSSATDANIEWNLFYGLEVYDVTSIRSDGNQETILSCIQNSGLVYIHDSGDTFDGTTIAAMFKTPDMMFTEPNVRKTLHYVDIYLALEGPADFSFQILYDEALDISPKSPVYDPGLSGEFSIYNVSTYDDPGSIYNAGDETLLRVPVQGSGKLISFIFNSLPDSPPFTLQALNISYFLNGRY